jgi:hypothetical protein
MSLRGDRAILTDNITTSSTLYIHPYNGDVVFLYNTTTNRWELRNIPDTPIARTLNGLASNTNYDVFLSYNTTANAFEVNFVPWNSQTPGAEPPTNTVSLLDGVLVRTSNPSQRLIGCLRTTNAGQTEINFGRVAAVGGSSPKLLLWNLYNQQPATFSILETGTVAGINYWDTTIGPGAEGGDNGNASPEGPFEKFGGPNAFGNKVAFITRIPQVVNMHSIHYTGNNICYYFCYSLDLETPMITDILQKLPGQPIFESCRNGDLSQSFNSTINAGYHYIQIVSMTYQNQSQRYLVWTGDRHSYGTVGTIAAY